MFVENGILLIANQVLWIFDFGDLKIYSTCPLKIAKKAEDRYFPNWNMNCESPATKLIIQLAVCYAKREISYVDLLLELAFNRRFHICINEFAKKELKQHLEFQ